MYRIFATASLAALLVACTASSDDVGAVGETDAPSLAEGVAVCPDNLVLALDDYDEDMVPATEDSDAWLIENGLRDGVMETDSGLQYRVNAPGIENGLTPQPGEEIFAHYHGYLPNGDVFDSSYVRGEPLIGPSNGFIAGWNEALADMKVCEARTLYIPSSLAYGNRADRPAGTLLFKMQLLRVNRDGADPVGVDG